MQDRIVKRFFSASFFYVVFHSRQSAAVGVFCYFANFQVQWNHINAVTNGSKKFGLANGVDVLSGQAQIS